MRSGFAPLVEPLGETANPTDVCSRFLDLPYLLFLDSAATQHPDAQYSFLAADPMLIVRSKGATTEVRRREDAAWSRVSVLAPYSIQQWAHEPLKIMSSAVLRVVVLTMVSSLAFSPDGRMLVTTPQAGFEFGPPFIKISLRRGTEPVLRTGFYLFVGIYAAQRFLWEFLKPYGTVIGPFNLFHLISIALIAYALIFARREAPRSCSTLVRSSP